MWMSRRRVGGSANACHANRYGTSFCRMVLWHSQPGAAESEKRPRHPKVLTVGGSATTPSVGLSLVHPLDASVEYLVEGCFADARLTRSADLRLPLPPTTMPSSNVKRPRNRRASRGDVPARGVSPQPGQAGMRGVTQRATADSRVGTVSLRVCSPSSCM